MTIGELVAAAVVDRRVWEAYGERAADGIYLSGQPGRALPFVVYRAWKVPTGFVSEEVRFFGPSGRMIVRWGPQVRRMIGSMDLTVETDVIEDSLFDETGTYAAAFILNDEVVGEIEVPVYVQASPTKLPKEVEDGLRRSDVIWVGVEHDGRRRTVPAWFGYKDGKIFVLSQRQPGPEEQTIPGVPDGAGELVVVTRRKGRDTALDEFYAAPRPLQGPEWEAAAKILADKRKSRAGPPADSINRWRSTCDIVELTPVLPG